MKIPYGKQHITEEDIQEVAKTLRSDFLTQGPKVQEFEQNFSKFIGSKYAVAVSNGTAALHLCALALGVNQTSNVITTPITFAASANCVLYCGGKTYFSDIDNQTLTIDLEQTKKMIESKPKGFFSGIIPVDFAGYGVNMEKFRVLANEHKLWIIEDACHALGGYFIDSKKVRQNCGNGNYADLAIFSFHPVKHIACGEGGMITTNDEKLYQKLLLLRTHGITKNPEYMSENHGGWYYEMQELGYNYRLSDINAALGNSQLNRIQENLSRRRQIAKRYEEAFRPISELQILDFDESNAYHLYIVQTKKRKELYDFLLSKEIMVQIHYIPVHTLPYYQKLGWNWGDFPQSEKYYEKCLSLPMYHSLSDTEQEYVIKWITEFFKY